MSPLALDALLAVAHHLAVFALVSTLAVEIALASAPPDAQRLRQLGRIDAAYGGLAMLVIAAGVLRVLYGAKGGDYYAGNPMFWTKIGLFVLVGLLSIGPTLQLLRWRRRGGLPDAASWQRLRRWMLAQAALLALVPVAAVLMARGIGMT